MTKIFLGAMIPAFVVALVASAALIGSLAWERFSPPSGPSRPKTDLAISWNPSAVPGDTCEKCGCPNGYAGCEPDLDDHAKGTCFARASDAERARTRRHVREELRDAGFLPNRPTVGSNGRFNDPELNEFAGRPLSRLWLFSDGPDNRDLWSLNPARDGGHMPEVCIDGRECFSATEVPERCR